MKSNFLLNRLVSPTRSLKLDGSQGIEIISNAGSIEADSFGDIVLTSKKGNVSWTLPQFYIDLKIQYFINFSTPQIRLSAENIILSNLKTTQPPTYHEKMKQEHSTANKIYQVCVCENGKLFLAHSNSFCGIHTSGEDNICRWSESYWIK